jgi:GNAT superfamily N-acetyltransferase
MKEYVIEKLEKERWKGTNLPIAYTSGSYYDISVKRTAEGFDIPIRKKTFETPFTHVPEDGEYPDRLYEDWWENARAFGIVEDGTLLAAIEICAEEWSNRLLITELFVGEEIRGQGYGRKLIDLAKTITIQNKYRVLMLETQSSNVNAVDFYLHEGFTLIGFDTCCYTNNDIERREVRFNMGWFPNQESD